MAGTEAHPYGYTKVNPIRVGGGLLQGPRRERLYLQRLRGPDGEELQYRRLGSVESIRVSEEGPESGLVDVYEVTCEGLGETVTLFLDMYHFETPRAPEGFVLAGG